MLDFASSAARSVLGHISLGTVEHRVEQLVPIEARLQEAVEALHRTAESMERNAEVADRVAESLPALTESLTRLCDQLAAVLELAKPLESVEHEVGTVWARVFRRNGKGAARV